MKELPPPQGTSLIGGHESNHSADDAARSPKSSSRPQVSTSLHEEFYAGVTVVLALQSQETSSQLSQLAGEVGVACLRATHPLDVEGLIGADLRIVCIIDLDAAKSFSAGLRSRNRGLRFACVSNSVYAEDIVDAIRAGAVDVLTSPVRKDRFVRLLKGVQESLFVQHYSASNSAGPGGELVETPQELRLGARWAASTNLSPMQQVERNAIIAALRESDWNAVRAAKLLGLGVATVYRKIKIYGIDLKRLRKQETAQVAAAANS